MMELRLAFPWGLVVGVPLAAILLSWATWRQWSLFRRPLHAAVATALRAAAAVVLLLLLSRPLYVESQEEPPVRDEVVVLIDRSQSMALEEGGESRYRATIEFARRKLVPAIANVGLKARALTFAEDAESRDGETLAGLEPAGGRTNLGRAVLRALADADSPPLAIVALTDGATNEEGENRRAMAALVESRVALVGIGFGSAAGPKTLALRYVEAPPLAPPNQDFCITANLESGGTGELPEFDLVLMRDGQMIQKKTVPAGPAGRVWLENFTLSESRESVHRYTVQLVAPADGVLRTLSGSSTASVRVAAERELRVLYVQGALTWDYKFIRLALTGDPTVKLTGLSRTSTTSVFYQNVENSTELKGGFPTTLEELAPFSVVVLSSLRHSDLTPQQQDLLARFCGEFGGGVLMIGGPESFDASWRASRLEQLLAVRFAPALRERPDRPFRFQVTPEAISHPVFRIRDDSSANAAWDRLPPFLNYAVVDEVKPGAQVWAVHPTDRGPRGLRPLMAIQQFGAGRSAVIGVQNFWRWRLAKESDPREFDRFWRQLLRHLAEGGRDPLIVTLPDQSLLPPADVKFSVLRQPDLQSPDGSSRSYRVRITSDASSETGGTGSAIDASRQQFELTPGQSVDLSFHAGQPGIYTLAIVDDQNAPLVTRSIEVRETNVEWQQAGRNMERLRQWASVSQGLAVRAEEDRDVEELLRAVIERVTKSRRESPRQEPFGMNVWMFGILLGCLSGEWILRKKWGLR
jgi:uncharacterized membrane protein